MSSDLQSEAMSEASQGRDAECKIKFTPPLFRQRYEKAFNILKAENVISVADFGCSDCRSLRLFRNLQSVELLIGVDIDRIMLENRIHHLQPLITDFVHRRSRPLKIQLFHGDILQFDPRLAGVEAVTMIEVIEHLNLEDLDRLPSALFGILQPKLVIITTPNADFNILFPNFVGFRHADHKFEWTRLQFSNWCNQVAGEYGYLVEYSGVGDPPSDHADLGCCSQVAIFRRSHAPAEPHTCTAESEGHLPYELMGEVDYPVEVKTTTVEEDILHEAIFYMNLFSRRSPWDDANDNDMGGKIIKLEDLKSFSRIQHLTEDYLVKLRKVLQDSGYKISEDGQTVTYTSEDKSSSSSDSNNDKGDVVGDDPEQSKSSTDVPCTAVEENWDI